MGVADEDFAGPAVIEVDGELAAHGTLDALYLAVAMTWMAHAVADVVAVYALEGVDRRTLREQLLGCWLLAIGRWLLAGGCLLLVVSCWSLAVGC